MGSSSPPTSLLSNRTRNSCSSKLRFCTGATGSFQPSLSSISSMSESGGAPFNAGLYWLSSLIAFHSFDKWSGDDQSAVLANRDTLHGNKSERANTSRPPEPPTYRPQKKGPLVAVVDLPRREAEDEATAPCVRFAPPFVPPHPPPSYLTYKAGRVRG